MPTSRVVGTLENYLLPKRTKRADNSKELCILVYSVQLCILLLDCVLLCIITIAPYFFKK